MAAVLEHVVGHWGAVLISVGLIISLLGALLSWVLLCAEIMFAAARTTPCRSSCAARTPTMYRPMRCG